MSIFAEQVSLYSANTSSNDVVPMTHLWCVQDVAVPQQKQSHYHSFASACLSPKCNKNHQGAAWLSYTQDNFQVAPLQQ